MSNRKGILTAMEKIARLNDQMADYLIMDPHCLDGNPLKDKAYEIVLGYFAEKQKEGRATGDVFYNKKVTMDLEVLLDCYDEAEGEKKQEYASKIAGYVQQTPENWLRIIPNEYQARAFSIICSYLELKRRSS